MSTHTHTSIWLNGSSEYRTNLSLGATQVVATKDNKLTIFFESREAIEKFIAAANQALQACQ